MEFRTTIAPLSHQGLVKHSDGLMLMGSCFADSIGNKLLNALFDADVNPFGTTFNPFSISRSLERIIDGRSFERNELFQRNGIWNSFMHHSSFSRTDDMETLGGINSRLQKAHDHLSRAKTLILTWGTSYIFMHNHDGAVVNNCHKCPSNEFVRVRISSKAIVKRYSTLIDQLIRYNPDLKIILTVSPIRHLSDGLAENQLSKSILRVAASELEELYPESVMYFPSYEALIDDLRDYRFYASDMVHASEIAENYIYQLFLNSFCDESSIMAAKECTKFSKRLSHRHMSDNQELVKEFQDGTIKAFEALRNKYPYLETRIPELKF